MRPGPGRRVRTARPAGPCPCGAWPLNVPVGHQETEAVEGVEYVAQGAVFDTVVNRHKGGDKPQPPDPQQHPGGVQKLLRAVAFIPPGRTARIFSQLCESHLTRDSPGYPPWPDAVVGHPQRPPLGTITPLVPHEHSTSFSAGPGTMRGVSQSIYCRMAAITRTQTNPDNRDEHTSATPAPVQPGQGIPVGPEQGRLEGLKPPTPLAPFLTTEGPAPHSSDVSGRVLGRLYKRPTAGSGPA